MDFRIRSQDRKPFVDGMGDEEAIEGRLLTVDADSDAEAGKMTSMTEEPMRTLDASASAKRMQSTAVDRVRLPL